MSYEEEVFPMTFQECAEIWAGFVGSQSPEEFVTISREQGHATTEEAVAAYVQDIPRMFDVDLDTEELTVIAFGLRHYLAEHGYH